MLCGPVRDAIVNCDTMRPSLQFTLAPGQMTIAPWASGPSVRRRTSVPPRSGQVAFPSGCEPENLFEEIAQALAWSPRLATATPTRIGKGLWSASIGMRSAGSRPVSVHS